MKQHFNSLCLVSVCVCSRGLLLQRLPPADVAAPGHGRAGLHWNALFLRGREDAELLRRFTGILERKDIFGIFFILCVRTGGCDAISNTHFMKGYFKFRVMHYML